MKLIKHEKWPDPLNNAKTEDYLLAYELDDGTILTKTYDFDGTLHSISYKFGKNDELKYQKEVEDKSYSRQYLTEEELEFLDTCEHCWKISGDYLKVLWC